MLRIHEGEIHQQEIKSREGLERRPGPESGLQDPGQAQGEAPGILADACQVELLELQPEKSENQGG